MTDVAGRRGFKTLLWTVIAAVLALGALVLAFRNLDIGRLPQVLRDADTVWIIALGLSIPLEQWVRLEVAADSLRSAPHRYPSIVWRGDGWLFH